MSVTALSGVARAHRSFLGRHGRSVTVWMLAVVALSVVATLALWPAREWGPNDPESQRRQGTAALARVLQKQGVSVTVVRTTAELAAHTPSSPSTLVVTTREGYPNQALVTSVAAQASRYQRVVLIGQPPRMLAGLGMGDVDLRQSSTAAQVESRCSLPGLGQTQVLTHRVDNDMTRVYIPRESVGDEFCFPATTTSDLGYLVVRRAGSPEVFALAEEALLTNDQILEADNAALGLTLLGNNPHVVWFSSGYEPDSTDEPAPQTGLARLLPPWWDAVQRLLTWTIVLAALWQMRRFGPLVIEKMPVVIKAIETTVNRGHLYERAQARDRAVQSLQQATQHRLRQQLALAHDAPHDALVSAVAAASGRDPHEVALVLTDTTPVTDDETMALRAQTLSLLEEEVRRT